MKLKEVVLLGINFLSLPNLNAIIDLNIRNNKEKVIMSWQKLVEQLIIQGILKSPHIIRAFSRIDRADFMPKNLKHLAATDHAFPIGFGQTISQPTTVAFMLELLQPEKNQKVLDIGSGSGWTTALLAELVGEKGKVYALEIIPQILEFGRDNVRKLNLTNVEFSLANGSIGWIKKAPFDRILCSASAPKIPLTLKKQLTPFGRLVLPVGDMAQSLILIKRAQNLHFTETRYPGFVFVHLRGKHGFR